MSKCRFCRDPSANPRDVLEIAPRRCAPWNGPGTDVVYVAESRALATLEVLVGTRLPAPLLAYVLTSVRVHESLVEALSRASLADHWRDVPPHPSTRRIGDDWAGEARSAVLRVPSIIIPDEHNYLLNPAHPDCRSIVIGAAEEFVLDTRLLH